MEGKQARTEGKPTFAFRGLKGKAHERGERHRTKEKGEALKIQVKRETDK